MYSFPLYLYLYHYTCRIQASHVSCISHAHVSEPHVLHNQCPFTTYIPVILMLTCKYTCINSSITYSKPYYVPCTIINHYIQYSSYYPLSHIHRFHAYSFSYHHLYNISFTIKLTAFVSINIPHIQHISHIRIILNSHATHIHPL